MARNGFPKGEFFITHVETGLVVTAVPGGTKVIARHNNKAGDEIVYTRTEKPVPILTHRLPAGKNELQGWYFDDSKDSWGKPANLLMSRMDFPVYGKFALTGKWADVHLTGIGSINSKSVYEFEDGYIRVAGESGNPFGLSVQQKDANGHYSLHFDALSSEGQGQKWKCERFS
ncbi:hypothetical protein [Streptomyces sp. DT9]